MKYLRNEPLKKHTSFGIGGPADYFCVPKSIEELREALEFARGKKLRVAVIGAGTNLLVLEQGFRGLVIKLGRGLNSIKIEDNRVRVGAGVLLQRLIRTLAQQKLGGLGFLAGIPGSIGGAVVMNAGAWGKEIGGYVEQVSALDKTGKEKIFTKRKLSFGYRKSLFQGNDWILTEVILKLRRKKKKYIQKNIKDFLARRKAGQPLGIPNCGSIFKNPRNDFAGRPCLPAGRLIEAAGCKGMRVGDAQVSAKHANFIINLGEAKARDVLKLITFIQKRVKDEFKILLEPEIKIMVNYEPY